MPRTCEALTDAERARHDAVASALGQETCGTGTPPIQEAQPSVGGAPSSYVVEGPEFVVQSRQNTTRYTISVLDEDGNAADFNLRSGSELVTVFFDVVNTAQGDVDSAIACLPVNTDAVALDRLGNRLDLCTFTMDVSEYPWFDIMATTIPHGTDVGISMVVDGNPVGDTHTVTFLNPGVAPVAPVAPPPVVGPVAGRGDSYSVVSYNDWAYMDVTDGSIVTDVNGVVQLVNDHPHQITGWLDRDEPVVAQYRLGLDARENLTQRTNPQMGQRTVEVLVTASDVQLTVTSNEEGPAYIRFLDSDMQPFGTDVDEEIEYRGADVVGLDSQGRLEMTEKTVNLSAAKALAYDQYSYTVPGVVTENAYLDGLAGDYYQGTFRFFDPCPGNVQGDHFYVQVYEKSGKYLKTTEKVLCVLSPRPGPAGLVFEIDSQKPGEGVLRFEPARNSVSHTVLLIDASNRNIVEEVEDAVSPVMFNEEDNVKLNNGWTYHILVIAAGVNDQYTSDAVLDYSVSWLDEADVPLSTDPSDDPTRMHPLCQVDDAAITALLADCDADPVNTAPMAVGTIAAVTVTAGEMSDAMDVSGYFSDADMDTLTYTASSDMEMYATAMVNGSMLTITGVAAGMATITVTATDMAGEMATQEIMVTVMSAMLTAPSGLMPSDATTDPGTLLVKVDWTPGAGAVGHLVMLFTSDWQGTPLVEGTPTGNSHIFSVDAGSYIAVVVAYDADGIQLAISGVTTVGGG